MPGPFCFWRYALFRRLKIDSHTISRSICLSLVLYSGLAVDDEVEERKAAEARRKEDNGRRCS